MAKLIYAGSYPEYQRYLETHALTIEDAAYVRDAHSLMYVPEGSEVICFGSYSRRMDYAQACENVLKRHLSWNG